MCNFKLVYEFKFYVQFQESLHISECCTTNFFENMKLITVKIHNTLSFLRVFIWSDCYLLNLHDYFSSFQKEESI